MLIVDVSNLAHIAVNARKEVIFNNVGFKAIPFIVSKVVGMVVNTEKVMFVFDPPSAGKKLDYFREYNPQVVYEVNVLYDLLKRIGFNAVRVDGYSADDLIMNLVDRYKDMPGTKTILSEDRDLVAAVYIDPVEKGTVEVLGPTVSGDYFTPYNMFDMTKVPYNFMNVFKTFMGCKSDRIKPLPNGSILWREFLEGLGRKHPKIKGRYEEAYKYIDITRFNNKRYVLNWLAQKGVDGTANANAVFYRELDMTPWAYKSLDWRRFNTMFYYMFGKIYTNQKHLIGEPSPQTIAFIDRTMETHRVSKASVFQRQELPSLTPIMGLDDFNTGSDDA